MNILSLGVLLAEISISSEGVKLHDFRYSLEMMCLSVAIISSWILVVLYYPVMHTWLNTDSALHPFSL